MKLPPVYPADLPEDGSTYRFGKRYEDWLKACFAFGPNAGIEDEITVGDTACQKEIKYDRKVHVTRNLFIEVEECSLRGRVRHTSPVFESARYLVQGDCHECWWIPSQLLWEFGESREMKRNAAGRAYGFILPVATLRKWADIGYVRFGLDPLAIESEELEPINYQCYYAKQQTRFW